MTKIIKIKKLSFEEFWQPPPNMKPTTDSMLSSSKHSDKTKIKFEIS
jgi:hypothetical protein